MSDPRPGTRWAGARAVYCAALIASVGLVQLRAEVGQLRAGYRPFFHAPARVPYSWDMFAIRMDRCAVRWDPPLAIDGRAVATWHDRTYALEFDTVFNRERDYAWAGSAGCAYRSAPETVVSLVCATSNGTVDVRSFPCPRTQR